jgi:hypothetical protein
MPRRTASFLASPFRTVFGARKRGRHSSCEPIIATEAHMSLASYIVLLYA